MPLPAAINRRVIRRRGRGVPRLPEANAASARRLAETRSRNESGGFRDVSTLMLTQRALWELSKFKRSTAVLRR